MRKSVLVAELAAVRKERDTLRHQLGLTLARIETAVTTHHDERFTAFSDTIGELADATRAVLAHARTKAEAPAADPAPTGRGGYSGGKPAAEMPPPPTDVPSLAPPVPTAKTARVAAAKAAAPKLTDPKVKP